jgi:non-specific serine/threonine protein kinase/serine/threonine-protein kinase
VSNDDRDRAGDQIPTEMPGLPAAAGAGPVERTIGPYRLLRKLGEGGMGEVWLADQTTPVKRRVAVKVIKHGMDTKQVVARFEAERQALAMMDHPAVAKVFEAGSTPRGRPYFAMEYVPGIPITEHCDRHKLSTRERLRLFVAACEGVQHAHQKAIIHRDLKPSNVLVSLQDDRPQVKIIDFGVAKATAQRLTERTLFTELGILIGTPEYMSPEQADLSGQDIDTRTDVYALGVILYELLIGALPFDSKQLRSGGFEGIVRTLRHEDPSRPSARLSTLGDRSIESAELRRTDMPTLQRQLKGDLDWITMKTLEKDRTRRYGSPAELAADIERYLAHEPVLASPPSRVYRATKFVRRHRLGVAAAAAVAVALVAGAVVSTVLGLREAAQRRAAERARGELETVVEFQSRMLAGVDPAETGRGVVAALRRGIEDALRREGVSDADVQTVLASFDGPVRHVSTTDVARRVLDTSILRPAAEAIGADFEDSPLIEARLRNTLARTYRSLGLFDEAEPHARRAEQLARDHLGDDDPLTLDSLDNVASVYWQQGRYEEAEAIFRRNLEAYRRLLGADHRSTLTAGYNVGGILLKRSRYDEAIATFGEVLDAQRRILGDDDPDTLKTWDGLAASYWNLGRNDEALPLWLDALERRRRVLGDEHSDTLSTINNLAVLYAGTGREQDAEALYREAIETNRKLRGDSHPKTLYSMSSLSTLLSRQGRLDEAEKLVRHALDVRRQEMGPDHPDTLGAMNNLAVLLIRAERHDEARRLLEELLRLDARVFAPDDPTYGLHLHTYGELMIAVGDLAAAAEALGRVLPIYEARGSRYLGLLLSQLAGVAARRGETTRALGFVERALESGYDVRSLREDPHLRSLRDDARFQALLAEPG